MATFTVTNTADDVNDGGSLRWALDQANNFSAGADTIVFASGVAGTINLTGGGGLSITEGLTLAGPGADRVTILADANADVLDITGGALMDVRVSGLTLSGVNGGTAAIFTLQTNLTLFAVAISGNTADPAFNGIGGIIAFADGDLTIENSRITGNSGLVGGLVYGGTGNLAIRSSVVSGNTGGLGGGGGGGGGYPLAGGVLFAGSGNMTVESSTVSGNAGGPAGAGGISFLTNGLTSRLTISASTISGNSGGVGGLYAGGSGGTPSVLVVNTTVANNTGDGGAGGIMFDFIDAILRSSTVAGNVDPSGGAMVDGVGASSATLTIENSIVFSPGGAPDIASLSSPVTANWSLIGSYISLCGCFPVLLGANNLLGLDPLLSALANNGGPVLTMLPAFSGPALNGGNATLGSPPVLDARGQPRISGGQIDLGAVEIQFPPPDPSAGALPPAPPPSKAPEINAAFVNLTRFQTYGFNPPLPATVTTPEGKTLPNPFLLQQAIVKALITKVDAGEIGLAAARDLMVDMADATTSVATLGYQFFTGKLPTKAGLDYLVSSPENPGDLNDGFYAGMLLENRYINFAVNLGTVGEGRANFTANYGALSLTDATTKAYTEIFGTPATGKIADILTPERVAYFTSLGGGALGAKAAMVGWLLAESAKSDVGPYAVMNENFLYDLTDGTAAYGADLHVYLTAGPRHIGLSGEV